jgi:Spy/CpxP family protein refolding chaperone
MRNNGQMLTLVAILLLLAVAPAGHGQTAQSQPGTGAVQPGATGGDPIRQLNLTPEQREQIRSIREQNKTERMALNEQLRAANQALEATLETDNPDEAVVEQRVREVAAAQATAMRMRILTEIRIRRVLTGEQRNLLRSLQQQARELRRERLEDNADARQKRREERLKFLQNQRSGGAPLFPRRQIRQRRL